MRIKRVYVCVCMCLPWMSESGGDVFMLRGCLLHKHAVVVNQMLDKHRA